MDGPSTLGWWGGFPPAAGGLSNRKGDRHQERTPWGFGAAARLKIVPGTILLMDSAPFFAGADQVLSERV